MIAVFLYLDNLSCPVQVLRQRRLHTRPHVLHPFQEGIARRFLSLPYLIYQSNTELKLLKINQLIQPNQLI
ncbi:MAG: hypothetical protein JWR12_2144 [Mucilaginibacter sp.]|jgi:hypothetical protein|nr:hypothetical protein [Mucilaginibacter sp.]